MAAFQVVPGASPDRLWLYQGNDVIWLPFPSDITNELLDGSFLYTHEGALVTSNMHAGMMDVQKLAKIIKLWTNSLSSDQYGNPVTWIEVDYRLDGVQPSPPLIINSTHRRMTRWTSRISLVWRSRNCNYVLGFITPMLPGHRSCWHRLSRSP